MRTMKTAFILVLGVVLAAGSVKASINIETWDDNTPVNHDWAIRDYFGGTEYGTLDWVSSLGSHSGVLRDTGGGVDNSRIDIVYTTDAGLTGDLSVGGLTVIFDFYSQAAVPTRVDVFMLSGLGGNEYIWALDVTSQLVAGDWASVSAPLSFGAGWFNLPGGARDTASQFNADLADIGEIGIMITYIDGSSSSVYGLDNFDVIPEPETWALLGIAFLSIGYSFRDRLDRKLNGLRVWLRS